MKLTFLATRRLALAVGLALLASVSARADDYYVDAVGGSGDANGGTSPEDAWRTITHALASVSTVQPTVHLAPGLYDAALGESFPLTLHGSSRLVGDLGRDVTIVDGGGAAVLIDATAYSSRIHGLWLRNAVLGIDLELGWGQDGRIVLEDALISGMQRGISGYVIGVTPDYDTELRVEMLRTVIRDCTDEGVHLRAESFFGDLDWSWARLYMEESLIEGCGEGVAAWSDSNMESIATATLGRSVLAFNDTGCSAEFISGKRSTVYGNTNRGLDADAMYVQNCIVYGNGDDVVAHTDSMTIEYSDIGDGALGVGNISADPLFVDAAGGDFRLHFWSPCADTGDPLLWETQLDGDLDTVRGLDMGAFELAPLAVNGTPRVGQTFQLELWGPAGGTAMVYLSRGLPVDPPFPTPLRLGDLELARQRMGLFDIGATATGPPGLLAVHVPDNLSLVGSTFSMQALSTSSVRTPRQAWTNPVTVTIAP